MKVVVIGGGVVGSAVAWRLARAGVQVEVLDGARPEAATAASGGMFGFRSEAVAPGPEFELGRASAALWDGWVEPLGGLAALGWVPEGTAWLVPTPELDAFLAARAWQQKAGLPAPIVGAAPGLPRHHSDRSVVIFPDEAAVHPPSVLEALGGAARAAGAVFRVALVTGLLERGGRCHGVATREGPIEADAVVLAAGSWSPTLLGEPRSLPITAVRGQIAIYRFESPRVIRTEAFYLVPRPGRLSLVGATEEPVALGSAGSPPAPESLQEVRLAAVAVLPELAGLEPRAVHSGLRPWSADRQPLVGLAPASFGLEGLVLATGHTRNGILQTPLTAELVRAAVLGEGPPEEIDPRPWAPDRF